MDVALDRDALYYPYIHIRDANWLKATLLTFPQVRRIVPHDFRLNDLEEVKPFRDIKGARDEPLLSDEPAYSYSVFQAQQRLLVTLKGAEEDQLGQYSLESTQSDFPKDPNAFQLHAGKMEPLLDFLCAKSLAWPARRISSSNPGEWFALHPRLGEVVMSLIAMAIASEKQLDIVTSSGRVHRTLARMDEDALVASLFNSGAPPGAKGSGGGSPSDMADELCQVVMLTMFDLSKLSAEKIAELQKEGKDLRRFKTELLKIAATIPDIANPDEREKRLIQAAKEVESEWEKYKGSLPRFAVDALLSTAAWKAPDLLTSALDGATSATVLTAGTGILVGLGVYAGFAAWRGYKDKSSSPYQYLTQIQRAGAAVTPIPAVSMGQVFPKDPPPPPGI
ncbi:TMF family protein [Ideonella sp. YS5]|uniref:TMF family protein n=1 Tax=Ideonella sp. YS5 TaxID=3453714 RepID=UPI003EE971FA